MMKFAWIIIVLSASNESVSGIGSKKSLILSVVVPIVSAIVGDSEVEVKNEEEETFDIAVSEFIISDLKNDNLSFENKLFCKILEEFNNAKTEDRTLNTAFFTNHQDQDISSKAIELISTQYQLSDNWEKNKIFVKKESDNLYNLVLSTYMPYKSRIISKQLNEIMHRLKNTSDDASIYLLQQEYFELKKLANQIDAELNRPFNY